METNSLTAMLTNRPLYRIDHFFDALPFSANQFLQHSYWNYSKDKKTNYFDFLWIFIRRITTNSYFFRNQRINMFQSKRCGLVAAAVQLRVPHRTASDGKAQRRQCRTSHPRTRGAKRRLGSKPGLRNTDQRREKRHWWYWQHFFAEAIVVEFDSSA